MTLQTFYMSVLEMKPNFCVEEFFEFLVALAAYCRKKFTIFEQH